MLRFKDKNQCEFDVLGMGEVMLRLSPSGKERISQGETFMKNAGGAELNVVSGISQLGLRTGIITRLPANEMGSFIKNKIRYSGTSDDYILYDDTPDARLGIYYYESGAYPRVPVVNYDRRHSSFCGLDIEQLPAGMYASTRLFHVSGITPALCDRLRRGTLAAVRAFKEAGAVVSFDVNYRAALWDEDSARACICELLPYVDVLFIAEETLHRMFRQSGELPEIQRRFAKEHPGLSVLASTMRTVVSPTRHNFTSLVYDVDQDRHYTEPPYENIEVVDRIGSGDAYVAGALYGLLTDGTIDSAAAYGNAMSAVKNTVPGDMTACSMVDIERVITAHRRGQSSEMVR